jgi:ornithine cyclodeaminase
MRYLDALSLRELLPIARAIEEISGAFGPDCEVPQRLSLNGAKVMPARVGDDMGVKIVSLTPGDPAGLVVIFGSDGRPMGIVDGPALTALRTGAASGLATKLCAAPDAPVLAVFGSGAMARDQVAAVRAVRPIDKVLVWSRTLERSRLLAEEIGGTAVVDPDEAARAADIIVTATPAKRPLFAAEALAETVHINAIGAYRPDMVEVPAEVVRRAWVVVDSHVAAQVEAGDLISAGRTADAEMGDILNGSATPPRSGITLFKTSGIASMDVVMARAALRLADAVGAGQVVGPS